MPSGVARAFPGGRLAHPEGQNEEENENSLRKSKKTWSKFEEKMRKVELLPTRDCEAGYGPDYAHCAGPCLLTLPAVLALLKIFRCVASVHFLI